MKTENTHESYYLGKEERTLKGCRTGLFIILLSTSIFWLVIFGLIKLFTN